MGEAWSYVHWTLILAIYLMVGIIYTAWWFDSDATRERREDVIASGLRAGWESNSVERWLLVDMGLLWPVDIIKQVYDKLHPSKPNKNKNDENGSKEDT